MKDQPEVPAGKTLEPLTRLLSAHAALISQTSEEFAFDVARRVQNIQAMLAETDEDELKAVKDGLMGIVAILQVQDILRQQVDVLMYGLERVKDVDIPDSNDPDAWIAQRLDSMCHSYVMRSQHDLHATVLGKPLEAPDPKDDLVLF